VADVVADIIAAGSGRFEDRRLAELFLNAGKAGTDVEAVARDAAITATLLFHHGGSVETLRHAVTRKADRQRARAACGHHREPCGKPSRPQYRIAVKN
jgi:hypothetical protein